MKLVPGSGEIIIDPGNPAGGTQLIRLLYRMRQSAPPPHRELRRRGHDGTLA